MFTLRKKSFAAITKSLLNFQRFNHTVVKDELYAHRDPGCNLFSTWKKHDSRELGLNLSRIPQPPSIILWDLRKAGFEAYLVGGCVRDLLLNRIPKDFDVITTAALSQVKKQFRRFGRAMIVGRRFPICQVYIKGCMVEVSSFDTVAEHQIGIYDFPVSELPKGYQEKDVNLWKNCMNRDFTVNSLFYDPYTNKIYDYVNAMSDIMMSKLRTLKPAHLSFEEDCARILRGLRLAARLGLSFSKETESAIHKLSPSILNLSKARIMMEVNYMLAYGAAQPSLCLLHRFHLLEILLPVQAAYLTKQSRERSNQSPFMLMKLFFNLDRLVSCDRPADSSLWVTMLAFHLALVRDPPEALVVLTFGSVLYYGNWKEGVKFARSHAQYIHSYAPEMSNYKYSFSDYELAKMVTRLALHMQNAAFTLTETDALLEEMGKFPEFPKSGNVLVPKRFAAVVAQVVDVLVEDLTLFNRSRNSFEINYNLLHQGNLHELRFVLGKIIMHTMGISAEKPGSPVLYHQKGLAAVAENPHSVDVKKGCELHKKLAADHKEELAVGKKQKLSQKDSNAEKNAEVTKKVCESIGCLLKAYTSKPSKSEEIQPLTETLNLQEVKPKPVDGNESKFTKVSKKPNKPDMDKQKDTIDDGTHGDDTGSEQHEPAKGKRKGKAHKLESKLTSEKHLKLIEQVSNKVSKKPNKPDMDKQKDTIDDGTHGDDTGSEQHEPAKGKRKGKAHKLESKLTSEKHLKLIEQVSNKVSKKLNKPDMDKQKDTIDDGTHGDDTGSEQHEPAKGKRKGKAHKLESKLTSEKHLKLIEQVSNKVSKKPNKPDMDKQKDTIDDGTHGDDTGSEQHEPAKGNWKGKAHKLSSFFR